MRVCMQRTMGCCKKEEDKGLSGPTGDRECRDIIWLLLFIVFWAGMLIIAGFAFANGEPKRLIYGTDRSERALDLPVLIHSVT